MKRRTGWFGTLLLAAWLGSTTLPGGHRAAAQSAPAPLAEANLIFSINVQDFSYPELSAAALRRIVAVHEAQGLPVDLYLTDSIAQAYERVDPGLLDHLIRSPVVSLSSHIRPPRPYYTRYNWLGMDRLSDAEQQALVLRYETRALDLATGQTLEAPGGYAWLTERFGQAPWAAAFQADAGVGRNVAAVYRRLGARFFMQHGRPINLGERMDGVYLRPEHVDLRLFEKVGGDAAAAIDQALAEARRAAGARPPYVVGVKMHDNDFFAKDSAWVTVYLDGPRRPPWDLSKKSPLLPVADAEAMWQLYEAAVGHAAALRQAGSVAVVGLPQVWQALEGSPGPAATSTRATVTAAAPTATAPKPSDTATAPWATATPPPATSSGQGPRLYLSGTMHVESSRARWPRPDALLAFFRRATAAGRAAAASSSAALGPAAGLPGAIQAAEGRGMRWSLGADIGWLRGEARAAELLRELAALGVDLDVHAHAAADRPAIAGLLRGWGLSPNTVASGLTIAEIAGLRQPLGGAASRWQARVLWGIVRQPNHGPGSDDDSAGLWRPKDGAAFLEHDPAGSLIAVGGGDRSLEGAEALRQALAAAGPGLPPVWSATVMVDPVTLLDNRGADIAAIEAWAARVADDPQLVWASIEETALAWEAAGSLPSRRDWPVILPTAAATATPSAPPVGADTATPPAPSPAPSTATAPATAAPTVGATASTSPTAATGTGRPGTRLYLPFLGDA